MYHKENNPFDNLDLLRVIRASVSFGSVCAARRPTTLRSSRRAPTPSVRAFRASRCGRRACLGCREERGRGRSRWRGTMYHPTSMKIAVPEISEVSHALVVIILKFATSNSICEWVLLAELGRRKHARKSQITTEDKENRMSRK